MNRRRDAGGGTGLVPVSRDDLKGLYTSTVVLVVVVLTAFGVAIWAWIREEAVNDDLRDLVEAESFEEDVEVARLCLDEHLRYDQFLVLAEDLTAAGATVGTDAHLALLNSSEEEQHAAHEIIDSLLPGAIRPIIDRYPAPACDAEEARALVEEQDRRRNTTSSG